MCIQVVYWHTLQLIHVQYTSPDQPEPNRPTLLLSSPDSGAWQSNCSRAPMSYPLLTVPREEGPWLPKNNWQWIFQRGDAAGGLKRQACLLFLCPAPLIGDYVLPFFSLPSSRARGSETPVPVGDCKVQVYVHVFPSETECSDKAWEVSGKREQSSN